MQKASASFMIKDLFSVCFSTVPKEKTKHASIVQD